MPHQQSAPSGLILEKKPDVTRVIHVSPGTIRDNWKAIEEGRPNDVRPAIVVNIGSTTLTAYRVDILGASRVVQNDTDAKHGVRVWIETESEIELHVNRQDSP